MPEQVGKGVFRVLKIFHKPKICFLNTQNLIPIHPHHCEMEALKNIEEEYRFSGISYDLIEELLDEVYNILQVWPNERLWDVYRGLEEGNDTLFNTLLYRAMAWVEMNEGD